MSSLELLAAVSAGNADDIKRLLNAGANPNCRDVLHGGTCLHCTVGNGDIPTTKLLLEHGADPNISTQNTSTSPLGMAALAGNSSMVALLLDADARLSADEIATGLLAECRALGLDEIADIIESTR